MIIMGKQDKNLFRNLSTHFFSENNKAALEEEGWHLNKSWMHMKQCFKL